MDIRNVKIDTCLVTVLSLALTACTVEGRLWSGATDATISGKLITSTDSVADLAVTKACMPSHALLFQLDTSGDRKEPALTQIPLDAEGKYSFNAKQLGIELQSQGSSKHPVLPHILVATDCSVNVYLRPLTGNKNQDITWGSTVVSYARNTEKKVRFAEILKESPKELEALFNAIPLTNSYSEAFAALQNSPAASEKFNSLFGIPPNHLTESAPEIVAAVLPTNAQEGVDLNIPVTVRHWSDTYSTAYLWKLDGVTISTASTLNYTPHPNQQGEHTLELTIGENNGSGGIDESKSTTLLTQKLLISNDVLPQSPNFQVTNPVVSNDIPISSRDLTLTLETGETLANCTSFSALALSEDSSIPQSGDFNIQCTQDGSQSLNFTLTSPGDGEKILRLWAKDAAGIISATPKLFTFLLDTAAPSVTIPPLASALSNATSQSFSFSGSDNGGTIDRFECRLNAGVFETCISPKTYTGLTEGSHSFSVKAIDTAGNESAAESIAFGVDLTPPMLTMTEKPPALTKDLNASFSFSAIDSGGGVVVGFLCSLDGATFSPCLSPKLDFVGAGEHNLAIKALDNSGNISAAESYTWTVDLSGPTSTVTEQPAALTNDTTASFSFSAIDNGGGHVASFECSLDGGPYSACVSPKSFTGVAAGSHTFTVRALDNLGNPGAATSSTWALDLTPPLVEILLKPALTTNALTASFSFLASDLGGGTIAGFQCQLDGAAYTDCTNPQLYSYLAVGVHNFSVKALDSVGNESLVASYPWEIDTTPPILTITHPETEAMILPTASLASYNFTGTCSEEDQTIALTVGALSATAHCVSGGWEKTLNLTTLTDGAITVTVTTSDLAGNATTTERSFIKDTVAPVLALTALEALRGNGDFGTVAWTLSEDHVSDLSAFNVEIYDGSAWSVVGTVTATAGDNEVQAYSLTNFTVPNVNTSAAKFRVSLIDAAGNTTTSTSLDFMIDSEAPTLTEFILNNGEALASGTTLPVALTSSDNLSGVAAYRLSTFADFSSAPWLETKPTNFSLPFATGTYTVYAQSKDKAENLSPVLEQTVTLTLGQPPTLSLIKPDGSVPLTTLNQSVHVSWKITLNSANTIAPNGISAQYSLDYGVTLMDWPGGAGFADAQNGGCTLDPGATGCMEIPLPAELVNTKFVFVLTARDVSGNKAVMASVMQNAPSGLSLFAGQDSTLLGGTALTTTLSSLKSLARDPVSGDMYVYAGCQILKIDAATSIISRFAGHPTNCSLAGDGENISKARFQITNTNNHGLVIDSQRNIYWASYSGVWKYDHATGIASVIVGSRQTPYSSMDGTPGRQFNFGANYPNSLDIGKENRIYFSYIYGYNGTGGTYYARVVFRLESDNTVTKVAGLHDTTTPAKVTCTEDAPAASCRLLTFAVIPGNTTQADRLLLTTEDALGFWEMDSLGKMKRRYTTGPTQLTRYLAKRNAVGLSGGYADGLYLFDVDTLAYHGKFFGLDPKGTSYNNFEVVGDDYGGLYLNPPPSSSITYLDANNNKAYFAGRSALGGDGGPAVFAELRSPKQLSLNPSTGDFFLTDSGVNTPIIRKIDSLGNLTALQSLTVGAEALLSTGITNGPVMLWPTNYQGFYKIENANLTCLWACGPGTNVSLPTLTTADSTQLYNASAFQGYEYFTDVSAITLGSVAFDGNDQYIMMFDRKNFSGGGSRSFIRKIDADNNMTEIAGSAAMAYPTGAPPEITPGTTLIDNFIGVPKQRLWVANGVFYILNNQKLFTGTAGGTWMQQTPDFVTTYVVSRASNKLYYLTSGLKLYVKNYTADGSGSSTLLADFAGAFQSLVLSEIRVSDHSLFMISGNSIYRYTHPLIE